MAVRTRFWLTVTVALLAAVVLGGTTYSLVRYQFFGQQNNEEYAHAIQLQKDAGVASGFLVQNIPLLSKANRVGLQPGDIITKYSDFAVTNARTFREAVDRNLTDKAESITLTVVRQGKPIQITAPPGLLGFTGQSWHPFSDIITDLVATNRLDEAASLAAKVDPSTLPEEEVILARILVLPENDAGQDRRRDELVSHLVTLVSDNNFGDLGHKFLMADRYKAAQIFLRKAIEADPMNIVAREKLALSYAWAGQFDQAGQIVEDILANHNNELRDWSIVLKTRGEVYASRKNYSAAAADFRKAIESAADASDTRLRVRYLLALAKMNNVERFEEGVAFCNQYRSKSDSSHPYDVDALRAYVLVRNSDEAQANATVQKWRQDAAAREWVVEYWSAVPDASDVVETWNRLMK